MMGVHKSHACLPSSPMDASLGSSGDDAIPRATAIVFALRLPLPPTLSLLFCRIVDGDEGSRGSYMARRPSPISRYSCRRTEKAAATATERRKATMADNEDVDGEIASADVPPNLSLPAFPTWVAAAQGEH